MNKLTLLSGGVFVGGAVLFTSAGAFAATPSMLQSFNTQPGMSIVPTAVKAGGFGHHMKLQKGDIAKVMGMTSDQLRSELQSGKTFEEIAEEHGMTATQVLTEAFKSAGFSDAQIQRILTAFQNGKLRIGAHPLRTMQ